MMNWKELKSAWNPVSCWIGTSACACLFNVLLISRMDDNREKVKCFYFMVDMGHCGLVAGGRHPESDTFGRYII